MLIQKRFCTTLYNRMFEPADECLSASSELFYWVGIMGNQTLTRITSDIWPKCRVFREIYQNLTTTIHAFVKIWHTLVEYTTCWLHYSREHGGWPRCFGHFYSAVCLWQSLVTKDFLCWDCQKQNSTNVWIPIAHGWRPISQHENDTNFALGNVNS